MNMVRVFICGRILSNLMLFAVGEKNAVAVVVVECSSVWSTMDTNLYTSLIGLSGI